MAIYTVFDAESDGDDESDLREAPEEKMESKNITTRIFYYYFVTKMVIARDHGGIQVPGSLQMNPTCPPELFQPSRDLSNRQ